MDSSGWGGLTEDYCSAKVRLAPLRERPGPEGGDANIFLASGKCIFAASLAPASLVAFWRALK